MSAYSNIPLVDGNGNIFYPQTKASCVGYDNTSSGLISTTAQAAIDELKERIDYQPVINGSGTVGTGYTGGGGFTLQKSGNKVQAICTLAKAAGGTATYYETIFTIAAAYRPLLGSYATGVIRNTSNGATAVAQCTIDAMGVVKLDTGGVSGYNQIRFDITYLTTDGLG